uniref:chemotaxis protein CheW n=1 Tax=Devosia sp. TaxID=1871048 RepID=UPI002FC64111
VPVIDLGARFGGQTTRITRRSCVVILEVAGEVGSQDIGMVVDAVGEVLEISPADIEPPPRFGARIRSDFILGMAKVDGKLVILLDVGQVLSADDIATLSSVATNEQVPAAD